MITIDEAFTVPAAPESVWKILSDPEAVVGALPGAELGDRHEDGTFDGSLAVKFGPLRVRFTARVRLDLDDETRVGEISARGRDAQGGTRVQASARYDVAEESSDTTAVTVKGTVELSGKLATVVEGGASVVVARLSKEFAANLANACGGNPPSVQPEAEPQAKAPSGTHRPLRERLRAWWVRLRRPPGIE